MNIKSYTIHLTQSGKEILTLDLDARNKKECYRLGKLIAQSIALRLSAHYTQLFEGLEMSNPPRIKVHVSKYQPKK